MAKAPTKQPAPKTEYVVQATGWLDGTMRKKGDKLELTEQEARYNVLNGALKSSADIAKEAEAEAKAKAKLDSVPTAPAKPDVGKAPSGSPR